MKKILALAFVSCFAFALKAQQKLPNEKAVEKQIEDFMAKMVTQDIQVAFDVLKPYWPISEASIDGLAKTTKEQLTMLTETFGPLNSYEFVRKEKLGNFAYTCNYVLKYEKSALRFTFVYYNGGNGWLINSLNWDDNWVALTIQKSCED